jgi:microcystin-dependent protein
MPDSFGQKIDPPPGCIAIWSGPLTDIPAGWVLCDGNNGTPDLLDRFICSVSAAGAPGATGGVDSLTLSVNQLPSHNHAASVESAGSHNHGVNFRRYTNADGSFGWPTTMQTGKPSVSTAGDHSHPSTDTSATGGGSSIDNRPPFYEVAFIMKL